MHWKILRVVIRKITRHRNDTLKVTFANFACLNAFTFCGLYIHKNPWPILGYHFLIVNYHRWVLFQILQGWTFLQCIRLLLTFNRDMRQWNSAFLQHYKTEVLSVQISLFQANSCNLLGVSRPTNFDVIFNCNIFYLL